MAESTNQSTGPRTDEGKAISSMNALKHGLSITRHVILKHENPEDFRELCREVDDIYQPQSARERLATADIAQCRWALRRFDRAEAFTLEFPPHLHTPRQGEVPPQDKLGYLSVCSDQPGQAHSEFTGIHNLLRYRGHWDRRHQRALAEFDRAQRARYAAARELRAQQQEQRKQQEELRRQQRHELHCALMQSKIDSVQKRNPASSQAMRSVQIPAEFWDQFVSSEKQTPAPPPPPPPTERTTPEAAA